MRSCHTDPLRILILGGSSEATALVQALATRPDLDDMDIVLSLAGRTAQPIAQPVETRVGGFGGVDGLSAYLASARTDLVIDATHPFAARMSENARLATNQARVPLIRFTREAWHPEPGDRWHTVATMAEAAEALGAAAAHVFLTVGRLQLEPFIAKPQHCYLVRTIEPVPPDHGFAQARFIEARGPFAVDDEVALMRRHGIEILVTKNSGGRASVAKIEAARRLGLPVVLVRPPQDAGLARTTIDDVLVAIEAHRAVRALRGV